MKGPYIVVYATHGTTTSTVWNMLIDDDRPLTPRVFNEIHETLAARHVGNAYRITILNVIQLEPSTLGVPHANQKTI